jgi:hypothetical protein
MERLRAQERKGRLMKPFNLQEALQGKPVVTRSGGPVKDLTYYEDAKGVAVISALAASYLYTYDLEGRYSRASEHAHDLFMKSEVLVRWAQHLRSCRAG